ncbi:thiamine biosynthesis protein ThiF [Geodermatophilus sp. Leaf369]|uniref:ThiF family adenylyltransferase n=1 Tax=Geodermatophilus sp. Leaf369 TaxID=1736354 RepID=UPI0006F254BA|nr:ThiF family adenylyltransferase [Geodermatophilus sp. Leaf369]KQS58011.1 thiamine biosynthesis protein ThiF [Geodermatophilus sp. Leaf369]
MTESTHPLLPPGTPLLRLGADTLQIGGADGGTGLRVGPLGERARRAVVTVLRSLDGSRPERSLPALAVASGVPADLLADLVVGLRSTGQLVDLSPADLLATDPGPAGRARAGTELPAAVAPGPGRWRGRRASAVVVDGATRVGVPLAALLAAGGVGRVHVVDRGPVRAEDVVVGGLSALDEGRPRALAAADAVRRVAPQVDLRPLPPGRPPDLVVLCRPWAAVDPLQGGLHRDGVPHLVATVRGETGVVGPLVVPGRTSCLRCAEATRRDEDPGWAEVVAGLREPVVGSPGGGPASGSSLTCLSTAAAAAAQVLAHLDGDAAPTVVGATLELRPPGLVPVRRVWPAHPGCPCRTAGAAGPPPI